MRLGTRGSALALAQARLVATQLERDGGAVELVEIRTAGDERRPAGGKPERGDKARFVKEIEQALLEGEIDLAVHSAKDVPGELPEGLAIVGVPKRAEASDALCGAATLSELRPGAPIGTSSLRRRAQLLAQRPDLRVLSLHGNVDTRLRRLEAGEFEAVVVACAGLARLGVTAGSPLPATIMTPAPGQGCLLLEARAGERRAAERAAAITDRGSLLRLTAERALVGAIDASCRTPVGAHAELAGGRLSLAVFVGLPDGDAWIRDAVAGAPGEPAEVGRHAGERLLAAGAAELLAAAETQAQQPGGGDEAVAERSGRKP